MDKLTIEDEKFRIDAQLGVGGFGRVYRAEELAFNRPVAIKVLDVLEGGDSQAKARFEREAKVLSGLRHPHIVSVYSYGEDAAGRPYIAMQYLEGETLGALLRKEGKLPWQRAVTIIKQVCEALQAAHETGVVHRDLKPDNIMLLSDPQPDFVKVLDFGLSGFVFDAEGALQKLTQTGAVVGTVFYMSPETCRGQKADKRSDIYSLGCILYQCLTGQAPIGGEDPLQMLYGHVHNFPSRINGDRSIPSELELVVFKAMQKDPSDRFESMAEFERALSMVLAGKEKELDLSGVKFKSESGKPKASSRGLLPAALAGLVVTAAIAVGYGQLSKSNVPNSASWQNEQGIGSLLWQRDQHRDAKQHFVAAIKVAPDKRSRFQSEIAAARYAVLQGQMSAPEPGELKEAIGYVRGALADAQDEREASTARQVLGVLAHDAGDLQLTYEMLNDEPWTRFPNITDKEMNGLWFDARVKRALGRALLEGKHRNEKRGRVLLEGNPPPESAQRELRDKVHIFSQHAAGEFAIVKRTGVNNQVEGTETVEVRYKVRHADSEPQMLAAIAEGEKLLQKYRGKKYIEAVTRTYIGLGYYDIQCYEQAEKLIADRPWTDARPGDLLPEWPAAGDCCVAALALMHQEPDRAIPLLEPLLNSGSITDEFLAFTKPRSQFFLATAYLMKNREPQAVALLKEAMPHKDEILFAREQELVKEQLRKHNLMVMWK